MGESTRRATTVTLAEKIAARIRQAILTGSLHPGKKLCPQEIAGQLGIHTPPVADALLQLEQQGLVTASPEHHNSHVAPLDSTDLRGIYQRRRCLEPELAARSCLLLSEAELDSLEALTETLDNHPGNDIGRRHGYVRRRDEIHRAHHDFHRRLVVPAATRCDLLVLEPAWLAAQRYMWLADHSRRHHTHVDHHPRCQGHRELLTCLRSRDPATVEALTHRHLDNCEGIAKHALTCAIAHPPSP